MNLISEAAPAWLVVVGASWGGLDAVGRVLSDLPADADCAVVVVIHRAQADSPLASLLAPRTGWALLEPEDKEPLRRRRIYVAPAGYHLMIEADHLALSTEGPFRYSRPSIDVLFDSAASAWGSRVLALVLTGANSDGAEGAARVAAAGGRVLVQDPSGSERREMPAAAILAVPGAEVVALADVGYRLGQMLVRRSGSKASRR